MLESQGSKRAGISVAVAIVLALLTTAPAWSQSKIIWTDRAYDASFRAMSRERERMPKNAWTPGDETGPAAPRYYAGAALVHGYDNNIDLDTTNKQSGGFGLVDLGLGALFRGGNHETVMIARGSFARHDIDEAAERWDGGALIDHHLRFGEGWRATVGGFFVGDHLDIDANHRTAAYAQLNRDAATHDLFVRLRSLSRDYQNEIGALRVNGDTISVDRTFSNIRTETSAGVYLLKDRSLAPYFQVGVASIDFFNQLQGALIDRDAHDVFAIAGVRLTFSPQLRIDVGARHNHRELDDATVRSHSSTFFDGKLVWTPSDRFYAEINVDRTFEDPEWAGARFAERTALQLYTEVRIAPQVTANFYGGLVRKDHIGAFTRTEDSYFDVKLAYDISERLQLFGLAGAAWSRENDTGDTAERSRVGIGIRVGH